MDRTLRPRWARATLAICATAAGLTVLAVTPTHATDNGIRSRWEAVSTEVDSTSTPVFLRGGSSGMRLFWVQRDPDGTWSVRGRETGKTATLAATTVVSGWHSLSTRLGGAELLSGGQQLLVFAGTQTANPQDALSQGFVYGASSADGATWTMNTTGTYSASRQAASTYGLAAIAATGGDIGVAFTEGSSSHVAYRLVQDPSLPASTPDFTSADTGSGDTGVRAVTWVTRGPAAQQHLVWSSTGSSASSAGVHVQYASGPASGPVKNAPRSARADGSTNLDGMPPGAAFLSGSGLWVAYVDALDPHVVRLWNADTGEQLTVRRKHTVEHVALSATNGTASSNGRLWLALVEAAGSRPNPSMAVFRIQPQKSCVVSAPRMDIPRSEGTYTTIWGIGAAPRSYGGAGLTDETLYLWANASTGSVDRLWAGSVSPQLRVKADTTPSTLTTSSGGSVAVRVTDACDPAPGVQVQLVAKMASGIKLFVTAISDTQGRAVLAIPKGVEPGSYDITATKPDYHAGTTLLRVRP